MFGNAKTGKYGDGTAAGFDFTNQVIAVSEGDSGGAATGFNVAKIIAATELLSDNGVDIENPMYKPIISIAPQQRSDLLKDEKFIADTYGGAHPLQNGTVGDYMGCTIIVSNLIPYCAADGSSVNVTANGWAASGKAVDLSSTSTRAVPVWTKDSILIDAMITKADMGIDSSKRFNTRYYLEMVIGGVRMEEEKVVLIPCLQS
jgi:hypothetical protein